MDSSRSESKPEVDANRAVKKLLTILRSVRHNEAYLFYTFDESYFYFNQQIDHQ
jgi:hypothetical protein